MKNYSEDKYKLMKNYSEDKYGVRQKNDRTEGKEVWRSFLIFPLSSRNFRLPTLSLCIWTSRLAFSLIFQKCFWSSLLVLPYSTLPASAISLVLFYTFSAH